MCSYPFACFSVLSHSRLTICWYCNNLLLQLHVMSEQLLLVCFCGYLCLTFRRSSRKPCQTLSLDICVCFSPTKTRC